MKMRLRLLTEDWWSDMSSEEQTTYLKNHPQSKKAKAIKQKALKGMKFDPPGLKLGKLTAPKHEKKRTPNFKLRNGRKVDVIKNEEDWDHFTQQFIKSTDPEEFSKTKKSKIKEFQKDVLNIKPPKITEETIDFIHSWKQIGGYTAIHQAIKDGDLTADYVEKRNNVLNDLAHKESIKVLKPIERGMAINVDDIDKFMSSFQKGSIVNTPTSGFSIDSEVARGFSYPYSDTTEEASVVIRILPNKNGEVRGLYVDGVPQEQSKNDYWDELELVRSSKSKTKVTNIIEREYGKKKIIEIELQEPNF
jgi:hypothetical protein